MRQGFLFEPESYFPPVPLDLCCRNGQTCKMIVAKKGRRYDRLAADVLLQDLVQKLALGVGGQIERVFVKSTITLCSLPLKIALQLMSVCVANQA